MVASPAVGVTSPSRQRSVVVLPAPFGPRNPVTEPGSTLKLRSSTALTLPPKTLLRPETSIRPGSSVTSQPLPLVALTTTSNYLTRGEVPRSAAGAQVCTFGEVRVPLGRSRSARIRLAALWPAAPITEPAGKHPAAPA